MSKEDETFEKEFERVIAMVTTDSQGYVYLNRENLKILAEGFYLKGKVEASQEFVDKMKAIGFDSSGLDV